MVVLLLPAIAAAGQETTWDKGAATSTVSAYPRLVDSPSAAAADAGTLPANIALPVGHRDLLRRMWQRSPTFRRQCARIAGAPELLVRVIVTGPGPVGSGCAKTTLRRAGTVLEADVQLGCVAKVVELVAHEFEHIIEQLDGVRLADVGERAPSLVKVSGQGTFETRRAIEAGRAVADEVTRVRK
jgi:hypothetical protein